MLKKTLILLVAAIAVFAVAAALQPDEFRVSRSIKLTASPAKIFRYVNTLSKWDNWSPWAKRDPEAKFAYEGPAAGVGAVMRWEGNVDVGRGSMTITESRANEFIQIRLEFTGPMTDVSTSEFAFKPEGDQTTVTWTLYGQNIFFEKAIGLVLDIEGMVGADFEAGLANMKSFVEAAYE